MAREANKNKERKDEAEPRRFAFSLSVAGIVSLTVVAVAALAWVFILGVLVGRGYKPEQAVPQLAEIMPRPGENATAPSDGVLRPEELQFFDALKEKTAAPAPAGEAPRKPEPPKAEPAKAEAQSPARPQAAPAAAPDDEGQRFAYVYQVAALRSPDTAREFAARVKALGLSADLEEAVSGGTVWHRVLVRHTGTPESTRALKEALKTLGVDKPIMKSKTPQ